MIQKTDLILLLTEMQEQGIDIDNQLKKTLVAQNIPLDVLKFINDTRQLDVAAFYERIRKNYNDKKSPLYINIVKEIEEPTEVITTLSALALQINLYSKHVENKAMFFKHARIKEILGCLNQYYDNYDITKSIKLIRLIKADLKAFEEIR
jgi:hypothetical protein